MTLLLHIFEVFIAVVCVAGILIGIAASNQWRRRKERKKHSND